jgi:prepilin-type processing-associated H-X9-DG protein
MSMYKLLAADQKEYGPVSADRIREWIAQGRANARTKLQAVGSADWKALAEFPEFANVLRRTTASTTPSPLPAAGAQTGAAPPNTRGMAVTSLVLGILGLLTCGITSLVGLVLGFITLSRIKKSNGQLRGRGLALAGTIVSAVCLLLGLLLPAMLLPALTKMPQKAARVQCMSNVRQLNLALMMYATDNKETFPSGTTWCDSLMPYLGKTTNAYVCPLGSPNQRCHYALNARLVGVEMKDIQAPAQTVLIFETAGGWNVTGGRELLPAKGRHGGAYAFGFADGHAEIVGPERLAKLRWEP